MLNAWTVRLYLHGFYQLIVCSIYQYLHWLVFALLLATGCVGVQSISEDAIQQKVSKIKLGVTTKEEIETLFGKDHTSEQSAWSYNLSDTALAIKSLGLSNQSYSRRIGTLPIPVGTARTNTRALITITFNHHQAVSTFQIKRFFNSPFINDYFFLEPDREIDSATKMSDFHLSGFDESVRAPFLEEDLASGQIVVEFRQPILHIMSINPYDRLSNEYRVFVKRETEFIETLSVSMMRNCEQIRKLAKQHLSSPITIGHVEFLQIMPVGCVDASADDSDLTLNFIR
ncbi:MAG TPA: hypothetical protein VF452_03800 [Candidatus Binatia bacterium]